MKDHLTAIAIILVIVALIACQRAAIVKEASYLAPVETEFCLTSGARTAEAVIPAWWDGALR